MTSGQVASIVRRPRSLRALANARGDTVRGEDADRPLGDVRLLVDEDRAALAQLGDDVLVVDDLLANVDGRAMQLERAFDRLHGSVHARAVSTRRSEQELLDRVLDCCGHPFHCRGAGGTLRAMSPRHLDRLTSVDAGFLHQEGPHSHMQLGGMTIFEGPPPPMEEFLEQIRRRLHLVPRYRHKLAFTPLEAGRPVWIDDPNFNLEFHIRHTALPSPGGWEQLCNLTARIFSQALDRTKPLWEMWLIEGLKENRFALISKNHHALIDGIAGVDLATVLFDLSPTPPPIRNSGRPWQPHAEPGAAELIAAGLRGAVRTGVNIIEGAVDALAKPEQTLTRARDAAEGIGEIIWAGLNPAPETPLNVPIGPHRRFLGVGCRLDDFKTVKNAFGGTVNDVVLAVVTGALRSFLISRGKQTEGVELRALVPVSVRASTNTARRATGSS